jgi:hypothetical protein
MYFKAGSAMVERLGISSMTAATAPADCAGNGDAPPVNQNKKSPLSAGFFIFQRISSPHRTQIPAARTSSICAAAFECVA